MTVTNINPEKEPIPRSWVPVVHQGGKEPPSEGECWLRRMEVGTVFVCSYVTFAFGDLYELVWKGDKFFLLHHTLGDERVTDCYVNPEVFCHERLNYEILSKKDNNDEQRNPD